MLTLETAMQAANAAIEEAKKQDLTISVCVVDANGTQLVALKMDDSLIVSPEFAHAKAYTAGTLQLPTEGIAEYAVPGKPYYGTTSMFHGKFMVIPGGEPIKINGKVVGAIGVGGSHDVQQDVACAKAGLAAIGASE